MANLVITKTANTIEVDFGIYSEDAGMLKGTWKIDKIINFTLAFDNKYVSADILGGKTWNMCRAIMGTNMIVDSVDGVTPSSTADLYTKLIALIA